MRRVGLAQVLAGCLEAAEQIPVYPLAGIKRRAMRVEVFPRFDREHEGAELVTDAVELFNQAVIRSSRASRVGRCGEPGVDLHLIRSDQDEDWGNALVPESAVKLSKFGGFDPFYLPEVDGRGPLQAEKAVDFE